MKIIKNIVIAIVALVVIGLIIGFFAPRQVTLKRSITINATPSAIFEEMNSMKAFNSWNPWARIDPDGTTYNYEGAETGVGSKMSWSSENSDVGSGQQEIVESERNKKVRTKLFFGGYEEASYADITLDKEEGNVNVTWTFEGDMGTNPIGKFFGLFMESMLGPSYEEGLGNLKKVAEGKPKPKFNIEPEIVSVNKIYYLGIRRTFNMKEEAGIGPQMGEMYGKIGEHIESNKITLTGAPFSVHHLMNDSIWDATIAMPVAEADAVAASGIDSGQTFEGKALAVKHMGDYMLLDDTHKEIKKYMEYNDMTLAGNGYEVYYTDPETEPDTTKWVAQIYYPLN